MKTYKRMPTGYGMVQTKIMQSHLSIQSKALYSLLASYTGSKEYCFPSVKKLTEDLHLSKPMIIKYLKELETNDLIIKSRLYTDSRKNNKYEVMYLDDDINESKADLTLQVKPIKPTKLNQVYSLNNNNGNNNKSNTIKSAGPPPLKGKVIKVADPEKIPGLHTKIKAAFFENVSKEITQLIDWKKETPHIVNLEKRAQVMTDPELRICEIITYFYKLIHSTDQKKDSIYIGQPFLPSILNSNRMWNQVINRMALEKGNQLSEKDKELLAVML